MEKRHQQLVIQLAVIFLIFLVLMSGLKLYLNGFVIFESQPDSVTGKDTYIKQNFNTTNYNTDSKILVGKDSVGRDLRGLIEFNVTNVTGSTILSAKLQVNMSFSTPSDNITINVYRVTSPWNSTEATWSNASSTQLWNTVGGDYSELIDSVVFSNISQLYNFTITNVVRGWANGSYTNYGLILISSDAATGNRREIDSSDSTSASARPKLIIDYTANAVPTITNLSTNSSLTDPKEVGQSVTFNISWSDLESDNSQAYVCNSSNITFASGCLDTTFCSTSLASTNPIQCSYIITSSNNRTTAFYVAVCDSTNCSEINQSYFYMNHAPTVLVVQPNGSETMNQSQGNYSIKFNVTDSDDDNLFGKIYYGASQNSTTNTINSNINLTQYCTDPDSKTSTTNNCTYSFNSSGLYGTYFLTIIVNDSFSLANDSSDNSFNIRSIVDGEAPNITSQWIESNITSGETIQIYANVSDASTISNVWAAINTTPQTNVTLLNTSSALTYNGSWIATTAGTYQFKVYAVDILGNQNSSMNWQEFSINSPNATAQNTYSASTVLPFHTIKVTGELNATDSLRDVYAYLNIPSGFTFLSGYPQNYLMGNFSAGQIKNATWFLSAPITEASYTLNITYTDYYSNIWTSSNMNIVVTSAVGGGYELDAAGYPTVAAGDKYYSEGYFKTAGVYTSADSTKISIYDSVGNLIVGPVDMSVKETGVYNYTYSVPGSQTSGQWETKINATKNSISYYANQFWKLVAALFDVRDITVINSTIQGLNISVVAENVGTGSVDLTLAWNLTRVDTNELLDSGGETFAVGATPVTRYYHPSTTYVGQVKIVFLGRYSGTETAGAYEIFSTTTAGAAPPVTPPTTPAGGGGGGGGAVTEEKKADLEISVDEIVYVAEDVTKSVPLTITNTGGKILTNVSLTLEGIDKLFYTISPEKINSLNTKGINYFEIKFLLTNISGEKEINYSITSNEITKKKSGKVVILSILDFIRKEIERLTAKIEQTRTNITSTKLISELDKCEDIVENIKTQMDNGEFINAKEGIKNADDCIDTIRGQVPKKGILDSILNWFRGFKFPEITVQFWIVLAVIGSILVLIMIILIIIKMCSRHKLMKFMSKKPETKILQETKPQPKTSDARYFEERVRRIRERLKD